MNISVEYIYMQPAAIAPRYFINTFKEMRGSPRPLVPVSEKYTLSVEEAAMYYGIGQTRLRSLITENPNAEYLLSVGNRIKFKRKKFEEYIDNATCI